MKIQESKDQDYFSKTCKNTIGVHRNTGRNFTKDLPYQGSESAGQKKDKFWVEEDNDICENLNLLKYFFLS